MEGSTTRGRNELLAFELWLDEQVCDEVRRESWGRVFLTGSAPLIFSASSQTTDCGPSSTEART